MQSLNKRLTALRKLRKQFGIKQQLLAERSGLSHDTVKKIFAVTDSDAANEIYAKYYTESNLAALTSGIRKILADYEKNLGDAFALLESLSNT